MKDSLSEAEERARIQEINQETEQQQQKLTSSYAGHKEDELVDLKK